MGWSCLIFRHTLAAALCPSFSFPISPDFCNPLLSSTHQVHASERQKRVRSSAVNQESGDWPLHWTAPDLVHSIHTLPKVHPIPTLPYSLPLCFGAASFHAPRLFCRTTSAGRIPRVPEKGGW
ncbi:uncharacterized protein B0T15DRAFT_237104 [Chaetomium strumarium]|uniref:Secreted protein n=1 Tax=Chaetomium strumarium TaxID=1170767 RepID=A0AAJ0GQL3_9PEZI|nr:hypothetical protein B0T15DRAFT_237104 [Chaetomium strumarium]